MGMRPSHCIQCGSEIKKLHIGITGDLVEIEPNFCRRCGNALLSDDMDYDAPGDEDEDDKEFPLYNFDDLKEIVKGIIPEHYKDLMPEQLERYAVQTIWKRLTGIDPYPNIDTRESDAEQERQMQIAMESGVPPGIILLAPRSTMDKTLEPLVRQYHLVWVNGLVRRTHLSSTPSEAGELRAMLAKSYYMILPCDCDNATYKPDETNPHFMRKA